MAGTVLRDMNVFSPACVVLGDDVRDPYDEAVFASLALNRDTYVLSFAGGVCSQSVSGMGGNLVKTGRCNC